MNINEIGRIAHENAKAKGFYDNPPSVETRLLLIHSEVSEACEAHRKGNFRPDTVTFDDLAPLPDDAFKDIFETCVKSTLWDEIADVIIRCCDFAAAENVNLEAHILAKMRYNATRPHKHGGKAY